ncbi:alpha/beta fold family hydrolase [Nitzschia inconspicua]|uniref:Alpha/beta fold family hydrolase n=1 Tax=Nitzschia inconspicua TaxID=303405 RepID=A0A9K3LIJ5_9STRA|nr:alpha/beta fold family hydrolase [Nitzschia inconspicua]
MERRELQTIRLRDGRWLRFRIDGPVQLLDESASRNSIPVIFAFHAMFLSGGSLLQRSPPKDYIVVCMNRPGYHGSSPVTIGEYDYKDFSRDVEELADHLGIVKFSAVGHSSGGPNALACASYLKDRVLSVAIMAGDPEYAEDAAKEKIVNGEKRKEASASHGSDHGQETTSSQDPDDFEGNVTTWKDWFLGCCLPNVMRFVPIIQVTNGLKNDFYLERRRYTFRTEEIVQPSIVVLGDQDSIQPNEIGIKVHHRLPNSKLIILKGVGHNQLVRDNILDMVFRRVIELQRSNISPPVPQGLLKTLVDNRGDTEINQEIGCEAPSEQAQYVLEKPLVTISSSGEKTTKKYVISSHSGTSPLPPCWKCHGHGKKYEKSTKDYTGSVCAVCNGLGTRPASQRSLEQSQQPGVIQPLRGYPISHPLIKFFPDKFAHPRAFQSVESVPEHLLPRVGELVASLGPSDWRIYQLQNGNKLTVDDFICAYVAAQEMLQRGWSPAQNIETSHGQPLLGGVSVQEAASLLTNAKADDAGASFSHADLGTGCGSVLMMLAWAFMGQIRSVGVEAQDVSFGCLKRGVKWNTGSDGSHLHDLIRIQKGDLRTWDGDDIIKAPYPLITGTPPYFPLDSFVASQNHEQKIRCRIPTRGGASDYIRTAARLLKETDENATDGGGVFCMVEAAFEKASDAVSGTAKECGMKIERRLDVITREGLPPRFSCWVMTKPRITHGTRDGEDENQLPSFPIETMTLRNADLSRTKQYSAAMECMGWVDFETHDKSAKV